MSNPDFAMLKDLRRNALPDNCTRCHGTGAEPPGCPESGPCEWCGGWTAHKRLIAGETRELRARIEDLRRRVMAVGEILARDGCYCECEHDPESHDDDCELCFGCRVSAAIGEATP